MKLGIQTLAHTNDRIDLLSDFLLPIPPESAVDFMLDSLPPKQNVSRGPKPCMRTLIRVVGIT